MAAMQYGARCNNSNVISGEAHTDTIAMRVARGACNAQHADGDVPVRSNCATQLALYKGLDQA